MIEKLISRFAAKFEILIKIVLLPILEAIFAIKRLVLARSWVRTPAESQKKSSHRELFFCVHISNLLANEHYQTISQKLWEYLVFGWPVRVKFNL